MITVNGPGELYYWVLPLLNTLAVEKVPIKIWIFLTPCQFSSGKEQKAIEENDLVRKVFSPGETLRICWGWSRIPLPPRGLILFLGGDIFYAVLLKKRTGFPLWVYGSHLRWSHWVDLYLARYRKDFKKYTFSRKIFVGDLLRSYVQQWETAPRRSLSCFQCGNPRILFLPGSRGVVYEYTMSFYKQVAHKIQEFYPDSSFAVSFPGNYSVEDLSYLGLDSLGIPFYFGETSPLMSQADITVTVPGSNNLELFYRERRALIVLPLESSTETFIPLTGIPGIIEKIPGLGPMIKRRIIRSLNRKRKWISLPNILMDREIYPELRGKVQPEQVASMVKMLLEQKTVDIVIPEDDFPSSASRTISRLIQERWAC